MNIAENIRQIHFVGIGGASMSKLARAAGEQGYAVTGSDLLCGPAFDGLAAAGVRAYTGHRAENIGNADLIVATAAIPADNPELLAAAARKIPVMGRAEFLGRLCDGFQSVAAFAGCHGKTTASGMAGYILQKAGLRPALHIGGELCRDGETEDRRDGLGAGRGSGLCGGGTMGDGAQEDGRNGSGARRGGELCRGDTTGRGGARSVMVVEACEYKRGFLQIRADFPVILNIGADHLDCYKDLREIKGAFADFLRVRRAGGAVIANGDDRNTADALRGAGCGAVLFGFGKNCEYRARGLSEEGGRFSFDLYERGEKLARASLGVPGRHNVYNALAAAAVARRYGVTKAAVAAALWDFAGMKRRFEYRAEVNGAKIFHDYAHHPDEIAAVFRAARLMKPARLVCVFQPHTYSRTKNLLNEFVRVLRLADVAVIADVYAARETPDLSVSGRILCGKVNGAGRGAKKACRYFPSFGEIREFLSGELKRGDLCLALGAGDIDGLYGIEN
ncbi:MAG: UDP-N-acetylmuramate--L-alanine ligase [Clostridiales bacterium]|nr:UDP-N-acetylmuramate--L-alanine ligase [Clostridiales bacterium]